MDARVQEGMVALMGALSFRGQIVVGGSSALSEQGAYSDADWYLIADSFQEFLRVRKQKARVQSWKKIYGQDVDIIVFTKWLVKHKWYYLFGYDQDGQRVSPAYDRVLLRNNVLKLAYRTYGEAVFAEGSHQRYLLGKTLVYGLYALLFSDEKHQATLAPPFFFRPSPACTRITANKRRCGLHTTDTYTENVSGWTAPNRRHGAGCEGASGSV